MTLVYGKKIAVTNVNSPAGFRHEPKIGDCRFIVFILQLDVEHALLANAPLIDRGKVARALQKLGNGEIKFRKRSLYRFLSGREAIFNSD